MFFARSSSPSTLWLVYLTYLGKFRLKRGRWPALLYPFRFKSDDKYWRIRFLIYPVGAGYRRRDTLSMNANRWEGRKERPSAQSQLLPHLLASSNSVNSNWWSTIYDDDRSRADSRTFYLCTGASSRDFHRWHMLLHENIRLRNVYLLAAMNGYLI